jgi:hypothetical protein
VARPNCTRRWTAETSCGHFQPAAGEHWFVQSAIRSDRSSVGYGFASSSATVAFGLMSLIVFSPEFFATAP